MSCGYFCAKVRDWLIELANITLGVLIALALGWVATSIGWRNDVQQARAGLRLEIGKIVVRGAERQRAGPCVERRLDQLAALLDEAQQSGRLPPIGDLGTPPIRTWSRGLWDSAVDPETKAHFEQAEREYLTGIYELVTPLARYTPQEVDAWTELYGMVGPGRAVEPGEIAAWRAAIGRARMINRSMIRVSSFASGLVAEARIGRDEASARTSGAPLDLRPLCDPIPKVTPAHYGAAPFADAVAPTTS